MSVYSAALEGIAAGEAAHSPNSPAALLEALRLYGRGLDLVRTLRTICRTKLASNSADTTAENVRAQVAEHSRRLSRASKPLFEALDALAEQDSELGSEPELQLWRRVHAWRSGGKLPEALDDFVRQVAANVVSPISAVYNHLTSTMAVEVRTADGWPRTQAFGACIAVLKNSDDPILRRTTFEAMNAWLAAHASSFLGVINALAGFQILIARQTGEAVLAAELRKERTGEKIYEAMFSALEEALPTLREAVTLRQAVFGAGPMKLWNLLSSAPNAHFARERSLDLTREHLRAAFRELDPGFSDFVDTAARSGWLDAGGFSKRSGGAWSDDLPAARAVRIFANYMPTIAGEAGLAHLFGAAYQMHVMHDAPMPARLYPISITEVMANFCETALFAYLENDARVRGDRRELESLEWQALRRITNCCLVLPARHRLLRNILAERAKGPLTLPSIGTLSRESWQHYFGASTDGADRYVWAYKPHFYRKVPVFYDWQYTLGFLLSKALFAQVSATGKSASGADVRQIYLDSGVLSIAEFGSRHLGADLENPSFWRNAIEAACAPIALCRSTPGIFGSL